MEVEEDERRKILNTIALKFSNISNFFFLFDLYIYIYILHTHSLHHAMFTCISTTMASTLSIPRTAANDCGCNLYAEITLGEGDVR